jgi:hypothetical protein
LEGRTSRSKAGLVAINLSIANLLESGHVRGLNRTAKWWRLLSVRGDSK